MPCVTEPDPPPSYDHESAVICSLLMGQMGMPVPDYVTKAAGNRWSRDPKPCQLLCKMLGKMTEADLGLWVYGDARNKDQRRIAEWWEDHQERDRRRKEREEQEARYRIDRLVIAMRDLERAQPGALAEAMKKLGEEGHQS